MTKKERLSASRLIAEFTSKSFAMSHISDYKNASDDALPPMKYHSDWNWIIPAWAKLNSKIKGMIPNLIFEDFRYPFNIAVNNNNKSDAFGILVNAIKWYKSKNPNEP